MANCIITTLKDVANIDGGAEYKDYLRIPVVKRGGDVYAQRYLVNYQASTDKNAFIVGDGHFTNTSKADYGKYQGENSSQIASMFTDGNYDVYVSLNGITGFVANATTVALPSGVVCGLDHVDYDRLFANNPDSLVFYYMPSVAKWFNYLGYLKSGDKAQLVHPETNVDAIAQKVIAVRGADVGTFYVESKQSWEYHPGKTNLNANSFLAVNIISVNKYTITGNSNWGVQQYTAERINGVWTYTDGVNS